MAPDTRTTTPTTTITHDHDHDHDHAGSVGAIGVGDHSGYQTGGLRVDVLEKILGENDRTAEANRSDFYDANVQVVNLMSSPGAGKTTLLREVLLKLGSTLRVGIVEGDVETSIDADRLAGLGAPVSLVNTANGFGGECHLDATMVRSALAATAAGRPRHRRDRKRRQPRLPGGVRRRRARHERWSSPSPKVRRSR